LWDGLFATMLGLECNHLGDLWKWVREAANFAASLFYNSISGVSKWFILSSPTSIPHSTHNLCIGQVIHLSSSECYSRPWAAWAVIVSFIILAGSSVRRQRNCSHAIRVLTMGTGDSHALDNFRCSGNLVASGFQSSCRRKPYSSATGCGGGDINH